MHHVLTLFGHPDRPSLDDARADGVAESLERLGAKVNRLDWLDRGIACDLGFRDLHPDAAVAAARQALDGSEIDVAAQPDEDRRKKLLIADMDSTIVTSETLDELAREAGLFDKIAPITARAMRGELKFEEALRERLALMSGMPKSFLERAWEKVRYSDGAAVAVATMREHGTYAVLVSGGFTFFTERVAAALGFDEHRANRLVFDGESFAGRAEEPILGREAKVEALYQLCTQRGLALNEAACVGDGANDLGMIQAAGCGVAYRAKPILAESAKFQINHGDLTGLLYIQGYRREQFVDI